MSLYTGQENDSEKRKILCSHYDAKAKNFDFMDYLPRPHLEPSSALHHPKLKATSQISLKTGSRLKIPDSSEQTVQNRFRLSPGKPQCQP